MIRSISLLLCLFITLPSAATEDTRTYELGAKLAQSCAGCHGLDGISPIQSNPNLAGQNRAYLEYALKAYRDRERKGGKAFIMYGNAAGLSDDEIAALALYFSFQQRKTFAKPGE